MLSVVEVVWIALVIVVMAGMWWVAYRMEPHWVSKDGTRFLCTAQELDGVNAVGHPKETRVLIGEVGELYVTQKRMMRRKTTVWSLVAKAPDAPRKIQIYVAAHREPTTNIESHLAIRIPTKSRCIAILDALLVESPVMVSPPAPESAVAADQPEQG